MIYHSNSENQYHSILLFNHADHSNVSNISMDAADKQQCIKTSKKDIKTLIH